MCDCNNPVHIFIKNTCINLVPGFKIFYKVHNIFHCCAIEYLFSFVIKENCFVRGKCYILDGLNRQTLGLISK